MPQIRTRFSFVFVELDGVVLNNLPLLPAPLLWHNHFEKGAEYP